MAENIETLAIKVDLDSNPVIKSLNQIADMFNRIAEQAKEAGNVSDVAFDNQRVAETAQAINEVSDSADVATRSVRETGKAGIEAGVNIEKGVRQAQNSLNQLDYVSKNVFSRLRRYLAPVAIFAMGRKAFKGFIDEAIALDDVAKKAKMSMTELDAWRRANSACGGSAEALTKAISDWTAKTGKSGDEFIKLGQRLNGLTDKQQDAQLKYLGLTRESASVFLQSNNEMAELVGRYRSMALTPQDAENARKFRMQWDITKAHIKDIATDLSRVFMPLLVKVTENFAKTAKFLTEHSELVKIALTGIAIAANFAFGKRSVLATVSFLKSPLGIVLVAIGALALALEDIIYFTKGYDSALGDLLKAMGMSDEQIENIRKSFGELGDNIMKMAEQIAPAVKGILEFVAPAVAKGLELIVALVGAIATGLNALISGTDESKEAFINMASVLTKTFNEAFDMVKGMIQTLVNGAIDLVKTACGKLFDIVVDTFKSAFDYVFNLFMEYVWNPIFGRFSSAVDTIKGWGSKVADFFGFGGGDNKAPNPNSGDVLGKLSKNTVINNEAKVENKVNVTINGDYDKAKAERDFGGIGKNLGNTTGDVVAHVTGGTTGGN